MNIILESCLKASINNSHKHIVIGIKFLSILFIVVSGILTIIASGGGGGGNGDQKPETGIVNFTAPSAGEGLPGVGTLRLHIYADNDPDPIESLTVETTTTTIDINLAVPVGSHSFRIIFEYNDQDFGGPFQLASANSDVIDITRDSTHTISFSSPDFTYEDLDSDGLTNRDELHTNFRTDPSDPSCVLDKSIIGETSTNGCTLG